MQDLGAFVSRWQGQKCCSPSCSPPDSVCECVALVAEWCCANGWPHPSGPTAATLNFPPGWEQVQLPQARPGDLVQWHQNLPGSDGAGHVAIYKANLSTGFQSFDQNWAQDLCELVTHNADYVIGAWRYEPPPPPPTPEPPPAPPAPSSWPLGEQDLTGVEP